MVHGALQACANTRPPPWLQEALGGQARDVSMCARLLAADGCRCVADVYMLAEADELSAEIPKVMRMKIVRACEPRFRAP